MIINNPDLRVVRKSDPRYIDGGFVLSSKMRYLWEAKGCVVEVPAGTFTDFASVPRGFRNIVSINGAHRLPAILHDHLYACAGRVPAVAWIAENGALIDAGAHSTVHYTRADADKAFRVCMILEGVSKFTAATMYRAVRVFGGLHLRLNGAKGWRK